MTSFIILQRLGLQDDFVAFDGAVQWKGSLPDWLLQLVDDACSANSETDRIRQPGHCPRADNARVVGQRSFAALCRLLGRDEPLFGRFGQTLKCKVARLLLEQSPMGIPSSILLFLLLMDETFPLWA